MKKLTFMARPIAVLTSVGIMVTGCLATDEDRDNIDLVLSGAPIPTPPPEPAPRAPECYNERYTQPNATIIKKVDMLFVADTSGSLNEERAGIADGIDAFITALPADVDYNIGVLLGHGSRAAWSGNLYKNDSDPTVLKSSQLSQAQIRTFLREKLTQTVGDVHADGGEENLYSLNEAIHGGMLVDNRAHGFFREDAALAVVFIGDEQDICARYPAGVTPVPDPDGLEELAFARDCGPVTPESVVQELETLQNGRPLLVSGIIYTGSVPYPHTGENEIGYGYLEAIAANNGIAVDMADGNYSVGLSQIGALVTKQITLNYDFTLTHPPVDSETIRVYVDGSPTAGWSWNEATVSVHVDDPGRELSTIDVNYCELDEEADSSPTPPPTATPSPTPSATPDPTPVPTPVPTPSATPSPTPACTVPPGYVDNNCDGIDDNTGEPIY